MARLGLEPWDIARPKEASGGGHRPAPRRRRTADEWLGALAAHPRAIQRPIITAADGTTVVGRDPDSLARVIEADSVSALPWTRGVPSRSRSPAGGPAGSMPTSWCWCWASRTGSATSPRSPTRWGGGRSWAVAGVHVRDGVRRRQDPLRRLDLGRDLDRDPADRGRGRSACCSPVTRTRSTRRSGAVVGGGTALLSHAVKAGSRLAMNSSPEPVTNIGASITEDVAGPRSRLVLHRAPDRGRRDRGASSWRSGLVVLYFVARLVRRGWRRWKGRATGAPVRRPDPSTRVPAMARVVVVGGGFGGLAARCGWPSSATRSPWSSDRRARAAR